MNMKTVFSSSLLRAAVAVLALQGAAWPLVAAHAETAPVAATTQAPDVFVQSITADLIATVRQDKTIQSGDLRKAIAVIEAKVLPHIDFQRMTASAVGRNWRQATPDQQKRLQEEFKTLLVYTYAGAVSQIRDQTIEYKPVRSRPDDTEVVVRSVVKGKGDPIQIDYRLEKAATGWRVYDVNVLGAWLVETYRASFAQEVSASGIDGLIAKLTERNKQLANKKTAG